ncbi:hypothetical protein Hanom_Chr10g00916321 [Helianthus anomalus]
MKPTPPNWATSRQLVGQKEVELKRMRKGMVATKFGSMQSMARLDEPTIKESYKKLEALRAIDALVPKRPNYEDLPISSPINPSEIPSAKHVSSMVRSHLKRQKYEDEIRNAGIRNELMFGHSDGKLEELLGKVLGKYSPTPIKSVLVNPSAFKVLKWPSDRASHELKIVRADG